MSRIGSPRASCVTAASPIVIFFYPFPFNCLSSLSPSPTTLRRVFFSIVPFVPGRFIELFNSQDEEDTGPDGLPSDIHARTNRDSTFQPGILCPFPNGESRTFVLRAGSFQRRSWNLSSVVWDFNFREILSQRDEFARIYSSRS